jgi:hypothetical protein
MNLHDIPDGRAAPRVRLGDPATFAEWMARWPDGYDRPRLVPYQERFAARIAGAYLQDGQPPEMTFRTVTEPEGILLRLQDQWIALQRAGLRPRDLPMFSFFLTEGEFHLLWRWIPRDQLATAGFPMVEGAQMTYREYPVRVVPDWADALRDRR